MPVDYRGVPWVTQPAPKLVFQPRKAPLPYGIDYPFAEQTAQGVALFRRFPEFHLRDRRIHLSGPWYDTWEWNQHFTRGVTSLDPMPNYRLGTAATDARQLHRDRKWCLLTDPFWWGYAARLADELESSNPGDNRIAPLRLFGQEHRMSDHREAFLALGARAWEGERVTTDMLGRGFRYPCIDIECSEGWEHQRHCFGWLYEGFAAQARRYGVKTCPITYGQWTFMVGAVHFSTRPHGKGLPEYLTQQDFLGEDDPTLQVLRQLSGVVSMDGYLQAIWGREPFYRRHANGKLVMHEGRPVFNDAASTRCYGHELRLEPGEAELCLQGMYRQAIRMYLMYHRLAGVYPADSTMRRPWLRNMRVGAWTRITNEGLQGIEQNDRPLPGWLLDMLTGMYLFLADDVVMWSSDFNTPPGPPGADYTKTWVYNAHGVIEYLIKAAHRYSALDPIHEGAFRWCWFDLPMVDQNRVDGHRYEQKPLVFGKLRTVNRRPWLELWCAWPALDDLPANLTVWIERNGKRSPEWPVRLRDGRSYFLDAWMIPEAFADAEGRDVCVRFTDQLGQTHIWQGDWRPRYGV